MKKINNLYFIDKEIDKSMQEGELWNLRLHSLYLLFPFIPSCRMEDTPVTDEVLLAKKWNVYTISYLNPNGEEEAPSKEEGWIG